MNNKETFNWQQYYQQQIHQKANLPSLKPLERPCDDCAVTSGFYLPYSVGLSLCTGEQQIAVSEKWFCHNDCNRACKGNWDFLGLKE